jgi:hypothetical protein
VASFYDSHGEEEQEWEQLASESKWEEHHEPEPPVLELELQNSFDGSGVGVAAYGDPGLPASS